MDLVPYAVRLQRDLGVAAAAGDPEVAEVAARLVAALEASTRLVLLDALVEAAGEITRELDPGAVEVRLRGREVDLVVSPGPQAAAAPAAAPAPGDTDEADDGGTARLSLRLPERLKPRLEQAAETAGLSVNAWLVRAVTGLLDGSPPKAPQAVPPVVTGQRLSGWVR